MPLYQPASRGLLGNTLIHMHSTSFNSVLSISLNQLMMFLMQTATSTSFLHSLIPELIKTIDFNSLVMQIVPSAFSQEHYFMVALCGVRVRHRVGLEFGFGLGVSVWRERKCRLPVWEWGCERAAKGIRGLPFPGAAETFLPISAAVSVQFICDELSLMFF